MTTSESTGSIIRVVKRGGFTVLDNTAANDSRLSFKALGIHTYLMTKPDNWRVFAAHLAKQHTDGKESVLSGLRELEACGYLIRQTIHDERGRIAGRESIVYERPVEVVQDGKSTVSRVSRITDKPSDGKPATSKYLRSARTDLQQELTLPGWLPEELWGEWLQHRAEMKKPVTPTSARMLFKKLERAKDKGHDPTSLIETAIARGWQGVVIPTDSPSKGSARRGGRPATQAEANEQFMDRVSDTLDAIKGVFDE